MKLTGTTHGELLGAAMQVQTVEEAQAYFAAYVDRLGELHYLTEETVPLRPVLEDQARRQIAYFAGYYDQATYDRVLRLYGLAHPVFGTEYPTPEVAMELAEELPRERDVPVVPPRRRLPRSAS
jgi:hypothetical protein